MSILDCIKKTLELRILEVCLLVHESVTVHRSENLENDSILWA